MNHQAIWKNSLIHHLTFIIYNYLYNLCALCGNFIVKNGAAAYTLIMQNEPKSKTSKITISDFLKKTSADCLRPAPPKNEPKTNPNEPKFKAAQASCLSNNKNKFASIRVHSRFKKLFFRNKAKFTLPRNGITSAYTIAYRYRPAGSIEKQTQFQQSEIRLQTDHHRVILNEVKNLFTITDYSPISTIPFNRQSSIKIPKPNHVILSTAKNLFTITDSAPKTNIPAHPPPKTRIFTRAIPKPKSTELLHPASMNKDFLELICEKYETKLSWLASC